MFGRMPKLNKTLPKVEVTEEELLKAFIASGMSQKDAEFNVKLVKGLGSGVEIDGKIYKIKAVVAKLNNATVS